MKRYERPMIEEETFDFEDICSASVVTNGGSITVDDASNGTGAGSVFN